MDISQQKIEFNGKQYALSYVEDTLPAFIWAYFVIVVPDTLVENMTLVQQAFAFDLGRFSFDATKLFEQLSYQEQHETFLVQRSDYRVKEYEREPSLAFSAILIVGALYAGLVFILMAIAILALKALSNISDNEKKYRILHRIGVSKDQQTITLALQTLLFFAFPIVIPVILTIPITFISEKLIALLGFDDPLCLVLLSILIVCTICIIYFIYYVVTFLITQKHMLKD